MLAHGGLQIQIEQTRTALEGLGVAVEPLRWWDDRQEGDILHHFGRIPVNHVRLARQKGMRVVMSPVLSGLGARPPWVRLIQKATRRTLHRFGPKLLGEIFAWDSYQLVDAALAMTRWDAELLIGMCGMEPARVALIPNGVEEVFENRAAARKGPWLVCTATIIELKQVLKLAESAVRATVPVWVIGKPFGEADTYAQQFARYAQAHPDYVRYQGPIADRAELARVYSEARGFVLLSRWESLSLSALEAAASGCPLLLSDLPWARSAFGQDASYCPVNASISRTANCLAGFYEQAPSLRPPPKPLTWSEVAQKLKALYETLLKTSR